MNKLLEAITVVTHNIAIYKAIDQELSDQEMVLLMNCFYQEYKDPHKPSLTAHELERLKLSLYPLNVYLQSRTGFGNITPIFDSLLKDSKLFSEFFGLQPDLHKEASDLSKNFIVEFEKLVKKHNPVVV